MEILTSLFSVPTLKFVFISVFFSWLHVMLCKICKAPKLPADGPPTYPILGCLISFYKNRHRLLDWYTELLTESATNTVVINRFGAPRTIVTANSKNVEYVLKTNFNNFHKGKPFTEILGDFLGYGIFNVDGELWRMQRKLACHVFSTSFLREFMMSTLKDEVENNLLPLLESLAETSKVVDLQELLKRLAFNMICKVSLGVDRCCLDPSQPVSSLNEAFNTASKISAKRAAAPLFLVWKVKKWIGVRSEKWLKNAVEEVRTYVEGIIRGKKRKIDESRENHGEDLLSRLTSAGNDKEVTRDMVISFIMAGRDTTSAAMTWLFWLLSCHPVIEQELMVL